MTAPGKIDLKKKPIRWLFELVLAVLVAAYMVPAAKHALFPDQMTRLEKMLRQSSMNGYRLAVDRKSESEIILTIFSGGRSITTEIYRDVIRELESDDDSRIFFTHAINRNDDGVFYLSRTRIETGSDLKWVRRIEVSVCDRIKDQTGNVNYEGHEPLYECEVPVKKVISIAVE